MSFDKKIREKLVNHSPEYDSGAWESFSKLLPAPWYTTVFTTNLGWTVSGLSAAALLFTVFLFNTKTERLNGEISTLTKQIEQQIKQQPLPLADTDTVYITKEINKYITVEKPASASFQKGLEQGYAKASQAVAYLQNEVDKLRKVNLALNAELAPNNTGGLETETTVVQKVIEEKNFLESENSGILLDESIVQENALTKQNQNAEVSPNKLNGEGGIELQKMDSEEALVADIPEQESAVKDSDHALDEEIVSTDRTDPEKPKKKVNWPKMRFGINSDYLGLKVLATGPTAEVFITDKISFNASAIFSGQVETKHPFAKDFNRYTGKEFDKEFLGYVNQRPELIEDISIKTSFIKLPLYFNYYINTWSRFNFIVSAGTKLDLSVYQNVDYSSGPLGQQIKNKFEAKATPKTFNNLFYGMGVQYKYGNFVGQLTPYFDFAFREADYFAPAKNFGVNASLKFEFGT